MTDSIEDIRAKLYSDIDGHDGSTDEATTIIKNLKILAETEKILEPEPQPAPEPVGFKGFLHRNSGDLIKVGGTVIAIGLIGFVENKFDVIFRSKAQKFI